MLKSQRYANRVFHEIRSLDSKSEMAKQYRSLCKRAGGVFRTVGLVQFVSFLAAKGVKQEHYQKLLDHLICELNAVNLIESRDQERFLEEIRNLSLPGYMHVSRTILDLLQWHKRLAETLISGEKETRNGQ